MDGSAPRHVLAAFGMMRVWHGDAPADLVAESRRIAATIAKRLADPETVFANLMGGEAAPGPYDIQTFSHGLPGVLLLHSELDRILPDGEWEGDVHRLIRVLLDNIGSHGVPAAGLYVGAAGHGFALWAASREEARYSRLLANVDAGTAVVIEEALATAGSRDGNRAVSDYDAVQGLAGTGRYLLQRTNSAELSALLDVSLDYLIALSDPILRDGVVAPGWFVSKQHQMTLADAEEFPEGNFNTGLAHGIAGPLALLSLAYSQGRLRPRHAEGIARMAGWLTEVCEKAAGGPRWPARVSWQAHANGKATAASDRDGWCYGIPGVARSLYLAGVAIEDASLRQFALDGFRQFIVARPASALAAGPTLCHGKAGIMQIALRMVSDSGDPEISQAAECLAARIVEDFDPRLALGYQDIEERGERSVGVDRAGFLNGAAGVALALGTYGSAAAPIWDRALLIS